MAYSSRQGRHRRRNSLQSVIRMPLKSDPIPGAGGGMAIHDNSYHAPAYATPNTDEKIGDADNDTVLECEQSADEDKIRGKVNGVESFLIDAAGVVTMAKQSSSRAFRDITNQAIPTGIWTKVQLNAESYDIQDEFDSTTNHRFVAKTAGTYLVIGAIYLDWLLDAKSAFAYIYKNGASLAGNQEIMGVNTDCMVQCATAVQLAINDYLELYVFHNKGSDSNVVAGS